MLNLANQHTVLIVKWDTPTVPNGVITGYLLNVSTISSTVYFIPNIKNNTITLTKLSKQFTSTFHYYNFIITYIYLHAGPIVPYYVSVAALTSKGNGEFQTKVAFTLQGSKYGGVAKHSKLFTTTPQYQLMVLAMFR